MKTYKRFRKGKGRKCPTKRRKHLGGWLGRIRGVSGTIDKYIYATPGSNEEHESYGKMSGYKEDVIKYLDKIKVIVLNIYKKNPYTIEQLLRLQTLINNLVDRFKGYNYITSMNVRNTNYKHLHYYDNVKTLIYNFVTFQKEKEKSNMLADSKKPNNPAKRYLPNVEKHHGWRRPPIVNSPIVNSNDFYSRPPYF